jgi:hypothetical protein
MSTRLQVTWRTRIFGAALVSVAMLAAMGGPSALAAEPQSPNQGQLDALRTACGNQVIQAALLIASPVPLVSDRCDLRGRLVRAGGIGAHIPAESNRFVRIFALSGRDRTTGGVHSLSIHTDKGTVHVEVERTAPGGRQLKSSAVGVKHRAGDTALNRKTPIGDECNQNQWNWSDSRNDYHEWYLDKASIPAYFGPLAEDDIYNGAENIDNGYNDCGLPRVIGDADDAVYRGTTLDFPQISNGECRIDTSGKNEVAFGATPSNVLALTCVWGYWWPGDSIIDEADMVFSDTPNQFFYEVPVNCSNRYELQGVATHEFGHAFGLDHVDENRFPYLTMSPNATQCTYSDSSLGLGDYNGLKTHYGP